MEKFSGWKTYAVAVAMIVYAWAGVAIGKVTPEHAIDLTWEALAVAGLRSGVKSEAAKTIDTVENKP